MKVQNQAHTGTQALGDRANGHRVLVDQQRGPTTKLRELQGLRTSGLAGNSTKGPEGCSSFTITGYKSGAAIVLVVEGHDVLDIENEARNRGLAGSLDSAMFIVA